jgi:hypothetical protein
VKENMLHKDIVKDAIEYLESQGYVPGKHIIKLQEEQNLPVDVFKEVLKVPYDAGSYIQECFDKSYDLTNYKTEYNFTPLRDCISVDFCNGFSAYFEIFIFENMCTISTELADKESFIFCDYLGPDNYFLGEHIFKIRGNKFVVTIELE